MDTKTIKTTEKRRHKSSSTLPRPRVTRARCGPCERTSVHSFAFSSCLYHLLAGPFVASIDYRICICSSSRATHFHGCAVQHMPCTRNRDMLLLFYDALFCRTLQPPRLLPCCQDNSLHLCSTDLQRCCELKHCVPSPRESLLAEAIRGRFMLPFSVSRHITPPSSLVRPFWPPSHGGAPFARPSLPPSPPPLRPSFTQPRCDGSRHHHFGSSSSRSGLLISSVRRRNCPGNRPTAQPSPNGRRGSRHSPGGNRSPKHSWFYQTAMGTASPLSINPSPTRAPAAKVATSNAPNR